MSIRTIFQVKCPICREVMRYKAFIGSGNIQGHECVRCVLILGNSVFRKLDEIIFSWRLRNKCRVE